MKEDFCTYFLYFIFYGVLGWLMEVICRWVELKKFINRGFLIGPICPIYGYGVIGMILLIGENATDFLSVFLKSVFVCSMLEYFTSYLMEKLFKARWWDYSKRKYNINGRICLETMLPFGILGCFVIFLFHPFVKKIIGHLNSSVQLFLATIFFILYIVDNLISFKVMNKIKTEIKKQKTDNTEEIRKKVMNWISSNSILYRHIKNSYPKFKIYAKKNQEL